MKFVSAELSASKRSGRAGILLFNAESMRTRDLIEEAADLRDAEASHQRGDSCEPDVQLASSAYCNRRHNINLGWIGGGETTLPCASLFEVDSVQGISAHIDRRLRHWLHFTALHGWWDFETAACANRFALRGCWRRTGSALSDQEPPSRTEYAAVSRMVRKVAFTSCWSGAVDHCSAGILLTRVVLYENESGKTFSCRLGDETT